MLELNICCDEACFWRLMLEQYKAAVSQDAAEVMKFAAWGLVVWEAGEILQCEDQVMRRIILLDSGDQPLLPEHT